MSKKNKILKAKALIENALKITNELLSNNKNIISAKMHLKQAIKNINELENSSLNKTNKETEYQKWWGNIVVGTKKLSDKPLSFESYNQKLNILQSMIDSNQDDLNKDD
jgi:hypothetical protein